MDNHLIKASEAQKMLQISKRKMASLLAEGVLPYEHDVLDKRVKLIRLDDVERLMAQKRRKAA